jgi:hypothetical protein
MVDEEWVAEILATAPPSTPEQRARIASLFGTTAAAVDEAA